MMKITRILLIFYLILIVQYVEYNCRNEFIEYSFWFSYVFSFKFEKIKIYFSLFIRKFIVFPYTFLVKNDQNFYKSMHIF